MINSKACKESLNPTNIFNWVSYKIKFAKEHPDYFYPDGLVVFTGPQGTGKTLSAVNYVENLMKMYPKAKLVTNLILNNYPIVTFKEFYNSYIQNLTEEYKKNHTKKEILKIAYNFYLNDNRVFEFSNSDDLSRYSNDEFGVIYLIDEIQLYFNSLDSKNINPDVMVQISQQRKQRKHIVATSQVFGRMAKPLREQFSSVIVCKNFLGFIQFNRLIDRDSISDTADTTSTTIEGQVKKRFLWFHSPKMYGKYDTYYVIKQNKFIAEEEKKIGIYGTEQSMCLTFNQK